MVSVPVELACDRCGKVEPFTTKTEYATLKARFDPAINHWTEDFSPHTLYELALCKECFLHVLNVAEIAAVPKKILY